MHITSDSRSYTQYYADTAPARHMVAVLGNEMTVHNEMNVHSMCSWEHRVSRRFRIIFVRTNTLVAPAFF